MTFKYSCPECGKKTQVTCIPEQAGRYYGPPEECYPSEPAEIDPDECEHCGLEFDIDTVLEEAPRRDEYEPEDRDE